MTTRFGALASGSTIESIIAAAGGTQSLFETRTAAAAATIDAAVKSLRTAGYTAPGDGGDGLYKRISTVPAYPSNPAYFRSVDRFTSSGTTDATNGGYWLLVAEDGKIDVRQMGGKCDGATNDYAAWKSAEEYWRRININALPGLDVVWGAGEVHFSGTTRINSTLELQTTNYSIIGTGTGKTSEEHSIMYFPANITGIITHSLNTTGAEGEDPGGSYQGGSQGTRLENFCLFSAAAGNPAGTGHGIQLRGRATMRNLYIRGVSQNGVHIVVTAGGELDGNANNWFAENINIEWCGGHGFYTSGADANAGTGIAINAAHNGGFGIYDGSFLGNTYVSCHTATNGVLGLTETPNTVTSYVTYGGNRYSVVIGQAVAASTTTPGTNEAIWAYQGSGGVHSTCPTWVSGTTYREGGAYAATDSNARNIFIGCYSESDQGVSQISPPAMCVGGLLASGTSSISITPHLSTSTNGGFTMTDAVAVVGYRDGGGPTGDQWSTTIGDSGPDQTDTNILTHIDPDYFSGGWRIKRYTENLIFDFNNTQTHLIITGPTHSVWSFGRSAPVPNAILTDNLWLGPYGNDARHVTYASAAPTTGAWAKGDIVFNNNASAGGFAGWYCVTSGTPGTWNTFGAISA
jgi:hypothetical protein